MDRLRQTRPEPDRALGAEPVQEPVIRRAVRPLTIGRADDPAERAADAFANTVGDTMRRPESPQAPTRIAPAETGRIRRSEQGDDRLGGTMVEPEVQRQIAATSGGRRLPDALRRSAETASGRDLGGVRVHTGRSADRLSRSLGAQAFTSGSNIFVSADASRPGTRAGDELLAHEVGHVVHEGGGPTARREIRRREDLAPLSSAAGNAPVRRLLGFGKKKSTAPAAPAAGAAKPAGPSEADVAKEFAATTAALDAAKADPRYRVLQRDADLAEAILAKIRADPSSWATQGPRLARHTLEAIGRAPGLEKEPGWGPLRRRLRIAGDEAGLLHDRARVAATKKQAGERYMADGAAGGMSALQPLTKQLYFDAKTDDLRSDQKDKRDRVEAAGKALGLTPAEQTAITVFTSKDFKYINPATANSKSWMLAQRGDDEKALLAAAPPGTDRDKAERQQLRPKFEEGAMHAGFAMSGFAKMPVWKGSTYRGEVLSKEELLAAFTMSKRGVLTPKATSMTRTAISSTTKSQPVAENFIMDNIVAKGGQNAFTVIWEYELTNGRDIAALSDSEGEQEIATLPGAKFAVTEVRPYRGPLSKNTRLFDPKNMFVVKCKQTA